MSDTMPDELWAWFNTDQQLRCFHEAQCSNDTRYIRAAPIDPATLAAIDETLAYFDEEFPPEKYPERSRDAMFVSDHVRGLTVGMLKKLRGMWK